MNTVDLASIETKTPVNERVSSWRDWLGIVASIGCAIHCAAMPFVIAYLPALGLSFLADESFHKWMALICFLIAIVAFVPGLRRHRNWVPVSVGAVGLSVITYAAFGLEGECCASCSAGGNVVASEVVACDDPACESASCDCESTGDSKQVPVAVEKAEVESGRSGFLSALVPWITPFGGILLVSAHLLNHRFGCGCDCCT